jgi:hypothetical protein
MAATASPEVGSSLSGEAPQKPSRGRWTLSVLFGIVAPVLCVVFDPIVFRSDGVVGPGFLKHFRLFAYAEIVLSAGVLAYYLLTSQSSPLVAGALFGGFVFAFIVGISILPLTILGLFMLIGVFGFVPFITGFVFLRNGQRCWRGSSGRVSAKAARLLAVLGVTLVLGIPASLQGSAFHLMEWAVPVLQSGSEQEFAQTVKVLK